MTDAATVQQIRDVLGRFHAALKAGDVEAALEGIADQPKFISNGVPHGKGPFRAFYKQQFERGIYPNRHVDWSRCRIEVDRESDFARQHGANAIVEPLLYEWPGGSNVQGYALLQGADGHWRIINQQLIPHPDEPAFSPALLADAGRPLENLSMLWTRRLAAPLDAVWQAVSTQDGLQKWWLGGFAQQLAEDASPPCKIDLRVGGIFEHHWRSEIFELRERELIDFKEFRIELRPDGDGTLLSLLVFTLNGDEWRAFWRCAGPPLYFAQFGGFDPWSARSWHAAVDQLEHSVSGKSFEHSGENPVYSYALTRFYLAYLRDLEAQRRLSRRPPLIDGPWLGEGFARSERALEAEERKSRIYANLKLRVIAHEPRSILVIEHELSPWAEERPFNLARTFRELLPRVAEHLSAQGAKPLGPPLLRILKQSAESVRFEVGYPVAGDVPGTHTIRRRSLPGARVVAGTLVEGDVVVRAQNYWPWVVEFAREQGFALDPDWGANGGWQTFVNEAAIANTAGGESQLYLPDAPPAPSDP